MGDHSMQDTHSQAPTPEGNLTLRLIPQRNETNMHGDISAGWVVNQMDIAAEKVASERAQGRVAGVSFESIVFMSPIRVGAAVCFYTRLLEIGSSSLKIGVEVWTRNPGQAQRHKVVDATCTYVGIAENGGIRRLPSS